MQGVPLRSGLHANNNWKLPSSSQKNIKKKDPAIENDETEND